MLPFYNRGDSVGRVAKKTATTGILELESRSDDMDGGEVKDMDTSDEDTGSNVDMDSATTIMKIIYLPTHTHTLYQIWSVALI